MRATKRAYFSLIERIGGFNRLVTLLTMILHFLQTLFCAALLLYWVRDQYGVLNGKLIDAYLAFTIISCLNFLFGSSLFYMWAWRFPEPEEVAKRRRIYGMGMNLVLSEVPLFILQVWIVWNVGLKNGLQAFTFVLTVISIFYSAVRVWTFFLARVIKIRSLSASGYPRFFPASAAPGNQLAGTPPSRTDNAIGAEAGGRGSGGYYDIDYPSQFDVEPGTGVQYPTDEYGPSASRYYYDDYPNQYNYTPIASQQRSTANQRSPKVDKVVRRI